MPDQEHPKHTLEQLYSDVIKAAEAAGVTCNTEAIWKLLTTYEEFFSGSAVSLRTTTKPSDQRELSVRYIELEKPHDPYATALEKGFIVPQGHPIERVIPELQAHFPVMGYGVDVGAEHGFEKIWPFFQAEVPLEEIYALPSLPPSIKNYAAHFRKFGFQKVGLLAVDFWNKTVNLYFYTNNRETFVPERLGEMLKELGFGVPPVEELEHSCRALSVYYTFSWESEFVERVCFVMAVPEELVPKHLHPLFEQYVKNVPIRSSRRIFFYNTTYAAKGDYLKIEADYRGTMSEVLRAASEASTRSSTLH
jgi:aromatic prenyltransferase